MSKVRLCAQILPTGSQCRQFALKTRPWCQIHADSRQRDRAAHASELVSKFPSMDLFGAAVTLLETTFEVQHKHLSPLHANAIYEAAARRLESVDRGGLHRPRAGPHRGRGGSFPLSSSAG